MHFLGTDQGAAALQLVKDFQVAHKVPSIAVGVTVDGKTVLTRGLDAKGAVVPGGESVRYNIGSVTKQFTAATVLAMIEDKTIVPKTKCRSPSTQRASSCFRVLIRRRREEKSPSAVADDDVKYPELHR